ncbi:MAG TPA: hypothetical protein VJN95_08810 [Gemmatimonadales bacterium]|nr:hypothetical protein [Gemmatimonadales bacterium]
MPDRRGSAKAIAIALLVAFLAGGAVGAWASRPRPPTDPALRAEDSAAVHRAQAARDTIAALRAQWPRDSAAIAGGIRAADSTQQVALAHHRQAMALEGTALELRARSDSAAARADTGAALQLLRIGFDSLRLGYSLLYQENRGLQRAAAGYNTTAMLAQGKLNLQWIAIERADSAIVGLAKVNVDLKLRISQLEHPKFLGFIPRIPKWIAGPASCFVAGGTAAALHASRDQVGSACLAGGWAGTVAIGK